MKRMVSKRKSQKTGENRLPKVIEDALTCTKNRYITEALNRVRGGEILYTTRRRRWNSSAQSRFCRLEDDLLYFRYEALGCGNVIIGGLRTKKVDLRHIQVLPARVENRSVSGDLNRGNYFTMIFTNSSQLPLNFITIDEESAKLWVCGLNYLIKNVKSLQPRLQYELSVWELFNTSDADRDGHVTRSEALKILAKNGCLSKREIMAMFPHGSNPANTALHFHAFFEAYKTVSIRPEICDIFNAVSADKDSITSRELYKFIQVTQKENDVNEQKCEQIILDFELNEESRNRRLMTLRGFHLYLTSEYCEIFNRRHDQVYQDMRKPLCHYYIASSHNTYLTGDQLTEPSSTDTYMNALLKGCRCVELDCWDGPDGEPLIYHGYTLTTKLKFKDVVEVIGRYAFEASLYPLVLSIENHCSLPQQAKMAYYLKTILGSELLTSPLLPADKEYVLPSPSALRGKILLKGKKIKNDSSSDAVAKDDAIEDDNDVIINQNQENTRSRLFFKERSSWPWSRSTRSTSASSYSSANDSSTNNSIKQRLSPSLSDMIVYCQSEKFTSFDVSNFHDDSFRKMSSFSEKRAMRLAKSNLDEAIEFHKLKLSRSYPSGTRTDSSNYDPQPLWNAGFQMVALNYQTKCDEMEIYSGKFRQNGNCGYVLKPEFQRRAGSAASSSPKLIKIRILSGYHLAGDVCGEERRRCCPVVEILVSGAAEDNTKRSTDRDRTGDTFRDWNEDFTLLIREPELAMVRFILRDKSRNREKVGQFSLPFASTMQGYRHIPFLDRSSIPIRRTTLFVRISCEEAQPLS
ncbi:1-phosphatidylinositol 4,5-bisphosphate phosphodiesterase zeta-1-like isoform X2 [Clavelina lepadiformis]|uniref:Phosphoinositide phospholipase C n=1 Tax=Clavelina lepadiformis TaxID=159417 RepID=A0ABP0F2Q3_CLALP